MALKLPRRQHRSASMVMAGVVLAALHGFRRSLSCFFSTPGANFLQRLLVTEAYNSWTPISVLGLCAICGPPVQDTLNKRHERDAL